MRFSRPTQNRVIRYGAPVALIIVAVLIAALDTNQVGNDIQVAGTAVGLVWLIALLGRDMGMGASSGRRRHVPDPPVSAAGPSARPTELPDPIESSNPVESPDPLGPQPPSSRT